MDKISIRMTNKDNLPTNSEIAEWIGNNAFNYWKRLIQLIEENYPTIFSPDWLYGGKKHGWSLRYKKSKSFCTFIPEKDHFAMLIVFGAKEREKVESIWDELSSQVQTKYNEAITYHDGKWVLLTIDNENILKDVIKLLATKRKPKKLH